MPRGRQKKPLDVQIATLDEKIKKYTEEIKKLQSARAELVQAKEKEDIGKLYQIIVEQGMTIEEVQKILENKKEAKQEIVSEDNQETISEE